jgi:predicted DNA-binding transcriptional regulator AlpA
MDRRFHADDEPGHLTHPRPPARRLLQRKDLFERGIRFSNTHLLKMEREGEFVARLYLSPAKVAWPENEVDAWLEARLAERKVAASS